MNLNHFLLLVESPVSELFPYGYARSTKSGTLYKITMVFKGRAEGYAQDSEHGEARGWISLSLLKATDKEGNPVEVTPTTNRGPDTEAAEREIMRRAPDRINDWWAGVNPDQPLGRCDDCTLTGEVVSHAGSEQFCSRCWLDHV